MAAFVYHSSYCHSIVSLSRQKNNLVKWQCYISSHFGWWEITWLCQSDSHSAVRRWAGELLAVQSQARAGMWYVAPDSPLIGQPSPLLASDWSILASLPSSASSGQSQHTSDTSDTWSGPNTGSDTIRVFASSLRSGNDENNQVVI